MNTIIEKIRAEKIIRLIISILEDKHPNTFWRSNEMESGVYTEELVSFLSDLEKSEKPTNIDFEQELYKHFGQVKDFTLGMQIGKYFYELGKQEKPTTAEGLEEEIVKVCDDFAFPLYGLADDYGRELINKLARHFAKWQKEQDDKELSEKITAAYQLGLADKEKQMMKEAVEVEVWNAGVDFAPHPVISVEDFNVKDGDKVRIIIVKED